MKFKMKFKMIEEVEHYINCQLLTKTEKKNIEKAFHAIRPENQLSALRVYKMRQLQKIFR